MEIFCFAEYNWYVETTISVEPTASIQGLLLGWGEWRDRPGQQSSEDVKMSRKI
jgi:hypothetical protein